ncbi:DoxX family protein [Kribbella sp. NPDC048915]|uniref:DoxX family protein n=1 Tax=Kribbella sp. NPDC048915 TaxID=3155148 RepID=UPI0033E29C35
MQLRERGIAFGGVDERRQQARLPRLKEWAYAGVLINMAGAAASNAATHQYTGMIAPAAFAVLALASWAIRPRSRRL